MLKGFVKEVVSIVLLSINILDRILALRESIVGNVGNLPGTMTKRE